jgi:putative chitinase
MISRQTYDQVFSKYKNAAILFEPLIKAMEKYGINTPQRIAMFLATVEHESGGLQLIRENMNYPAKRLAEVWTGRFAEGGKPNDMAKLLANKPEEIANVVYANRMGNGNYKSGEGWKYRGGGLIGTTGKENFEKTGKAIGVDLVSHPELIIQPEAAAHSAAWFAQAHGLNQIADTGNFTRYSAKVNVGNPDADPKKIIGLDKRVAKYERIISIINSSHQA